MNYLNEGLEKISKIFELCFMDPDEDSYDLANLLPKAKGILSTLQLW